MKQKDMRERLFSLYNVKSVIALAELLPVKYSQVRLNNYLNGSRKPPMDLLQAVSEKAGKSINWVLTGEEPTLDITKPELELLAAIKQRGGVTEETKNQILSILDLVHPPKKNKA